MHDAIVIGSGPNGLCAAAHLASAGWSVLVLEANEHLGGACRSGALTLPGFVHDLGAGFFPFAKDSPGFAPLKLDRYGLELCHAPIASAHPSMDGSCASISRVVSESVRAFGKDGEAWRAIATWFERERNVVIPALLGPFPALGAGLDLGFDNALTIASIALQSGRQFGESRFSTDAAKRVVPSLGLHADVGPDDTMGAIVGFMLAIMAATAGFPVAKGGAGAITDALLAFLKEHNGKVITGQRVEQIVVRQGKAVAVRTAQGEEFPAAKAILADVAAPTLYLKLLGEEHLSGRVTRVMKRFQQGFGTFKMDWALSGPVPWNHPDARQAAVVHAGDNVNDLARFTSEVRAGKIPTNPYLVIGQQSLCDATRAPAGQHTLYAYSRVPSAVPGGWAAHSQSFADAIENRIEGLAPGFKHTILGRSILSPVDLQSMNDNLIGGDHGGGSAGIKHQLIFRPIFPYFRYRTPVTGAYLCSSYAHPGAGVHGACGKNAADAALADHGGASLATYGNTLPLKENAEQIV
jgi:phytoene dehydrogenase-like protein